MRRSGGCAGTLSAGNGQAAYENHQPEKILLSGRWLHGAEHGAARPETDVKGHRAQASQPCYHERPLPAGPELLADRHTDRGLLPPPRRPLYRHERRDRHPAGEQRHRALQKYPK